MTNDRRTVLGWAQPWPQPTKPTQPATPADSQLPPHLTYAPEAPQGSQPQGSQVAPLPPRVPPYAAYDQPVDRPTQPGADALLHASLAKTQPAPPYAQPYAPQPYAQPYYDQQTVIESQYQQPQQQGYNPQQPAQSYDQPASYPQSSGPYTYPSAQPYLQPQPQPQPQFAPQPAFPSQPQAPFVRRKSPSTPPAETKSTSKLRDKANATVGSSERLRFVRRTYLHLFMAILAFAGLEYLLVTNEFLVETISVPFTRFALGGRWNWGIVLGVFMVVSWIADYWARHASSRVMQYLGLGFYVIAEALIFVPLLAIVAYKTQSILARGGGEPHILRDSALVTLALFGALTASVLLSRKDFSFLRAGLAMASAAALMLIGLSLLFGFNLGMFSSVALMFWYIIRIVMKMRD